MVVRPMPGMRRCSRRAETLDRKSTRLNSSHTVIYTLSLHDALPISGFLRTGAHGQFVTKVADGGEAHAGDAEVLAEGGDILHVKFVEGDDAIDRLRPVHVADGVDQVVLRNIFGHEEQLVERFARPVTVAEFFDS